MRQRPERFRKATCRGRNRSTILGSGRRIRDFYPENTSYHEAPPVSARARGLQCFRFNLTPPLPLGIRWSDLTARAECEIPASAGLSVNTLVAAAASGQLSGLSSEERRALVGLPDPTELLGRSTDTARVLDALAGGPDRAPSVHDLSQPVPCADDINAWLGDWRDSLADELALACKIEQQLAALETEVVAAAGGAPEWDSAVEPVDLLACAVEMASLSTASVRRRQEGMELPAPPVRAKPASPRPEVRSPSAPRIGGPSRHSVMPERPPDTRTLGRFGAMRESARSLARFGREALHRLRRRRLEGEALRKRRHEIMKKALAQHQGRPIGPVSIRSEQTTTMPKRGKPTWKPGDPFAGRTTYHQARFRWHAMLLTAGGVAGVGYLALRLLAFADVLAG